MDTESLRYTLRYVYLRIRIEFEVIRINIRVFHDCESEILEKLNIIKTGFADKISTIGHRHIISSLLGSGGVPTDTNRITGDLDP
jgi:hypothetical protein